MEGDTLVALSTPPGESGIAVIRISGPESVDILDRMSPGAGSWKSHSLHRRVIRNGAGEHVDEVVAAVMRAPDSYTGEDVVEISCHGSMYVAGEIIEEAVRQGARLAEPGEFTRRAFLNGKLDLAQAEAVVDLIEAETRLQSRVALEHLEGSLSKKVRNIEDTLLESLAMVELGIDFSEEDIEAFDPEELLGRSRKIRKELSGLIDSEVAGRKLRNGFRVTILGPRNAGKSSIYNALIGEERAIVSPVPGTTRDILRERIHIKGFTYHLEDTAGEAETECEIETRGISMGRRAAEAADLVIMVVDGSEPWPREAGGILDRQGERKHIGVINKMDLAPFSGGASAKTHGSGAIGVSALTGEGLDGLRERIYAETVIKGGSAAGERIALNARQASALRAAAAALERMEKELAGESSPEILSLEIREAADACGMVTGRTVSEDLLDTVFSRFCIGK
jgi:tRNA modification GTPase